MEKLDVAVAAAGAVVLLVAIVGAAVMGGSGGVEYDVVFAKETKPGAPLTPAGASPASATFGVADLNVTQVAVKVFVNATAAPGGYTAHVKLLGPANATAEKDGSAALGASSLAIDVSIALPALGHGGRIAATSPDDALRRASVENATAGAGNWTVEVSFAPAGPLPPQGVAVVALPSWTILRANATLVAPDSR